MSTEQFLKIIYLALHSRALKSQTFVVWILSNSSIPITTSSPKLKAGHLKGKWETKPSTVIQCMCLKSWHLHHLFLLMFKITNLKRPVCALGHLRDTSGFLLTKTPCVLQLRPTPLNYACEGWGRKVTAAAPALNWAKYQCHLRQMPAFLLLSEPGQVLQVHYVDTSASSALSDKWKKNYLTEQK